jgi:hypothetical protein
MESHLKQQNNSDNTAFVLGNGTSRSVINPKKLLNLGRVYGCNAQYREYNPHHLIAVDVKMINEIVDSGYHLNNSVWTNPNKSVKTKDNINFFQPHKGWSSGPTALWFAATQHYKTIYILGFDFQGLNGKFNNVYADTPNYKRSTEAATFFGNWLNQTERVIKEFKGTQFFRIIEQGNFVPEKLMALKNLKHISYDDFKNQYENTDFS